MESHVEHFGVPGMKWGVRRRNLRESSAEANQAEADVKIAKANLKLARQIRRQDRRDMTASIATGAAIAATVLTVAGHVAVRQLG